MIMVPLLGCFQLDFFGKKRQPTRQLLPMSLRSLSVALYCPKAEDAYDPPKTVDIKL